MISFCFQNLYKTSTIQVTLMILQAVRSENGSILSQDTDFTKPFEHSEEPIRIWKSFSPLLTAHFLSAKVHQRLRLLPFSCFYTSFRIQRRLLYLQSFIGNIAETSVLCLVCSILNISLFARYSCFVAFLHSSLARQRELLYKYSIMYDISRILLNFFTRYQIV